MVPQEKPNHHGKENSGQKTPQNTPKSDHSWNAAPSADQEMQPELKHTGFQPIWGHAFTFRPQINPKSERIAARIYKETNCDGNDPGDSKSVLSKVQDWSWL